jgi:hypothetical protein
MSSKRTPLLVGNRLTQLPSYIPKILVIMDLRSDQHLPNSQPVCVCSFDASKKNSVAKKVGVRTLISNPHDRGRSSITSSFFFPSTLHIYIYIHIHSSHVSVFLQVGAPPEVVARLEEACASAASMGPANTDGIGEDPALDQFMEAYCEMLTKYEQELSKPLKEAMVFLQRVECQFRALTLSSPNSGDHNLSPTLPLFPILSLLVCVFVSFELQK